MTKQARHLLYAPPSSIVPGMVETRTFKTTEALVRQALELLRKTLPTAGNLMLSGGTTPYAVYNRLAAAPCPVHPDRTLFLSDERMVPADSPSSNAGNLMPMLEALECKDRFFRVDSGLPSEEATDRFARNLEVLDTMDLGFLGLGTDGHTAGFFTSEQANRKSGALTLHTDRPDGMQGVSITPALLHRVERIVLLVTGEVKRGMINTLLNEPETIPAGIALAGHPDVELWTDIRP